jgi:hypothetical protein
MVAVQAPPTPWPTPQTTTDTRIASSGALVIGILDSSFTVCVQFMTAIRVSMVV